MSSLADGADAAGVRKRDFVPYEKYFPAFVRANNVRLKVTPQHLDACRKLNDFILGLTPYWFCNLNIPPGFGKTKMAEGALTWLHGYFPECHDIYTSYAQVRAAASVRYVRDTLTADWYRDMFPRTRVGNIQQSDQFNTTAGGLVYGDGVGGGITGYGIGLQDRLCGGIGVIDDAAKPDEAQSPTQADHLNDWLEGTFVNRKRSPNAGILNIAQRLNQNDISGHIEETYKDKVLIIKVPALVDDVSQIPHIRSTESLLKMREVAPFHFFAQYQQEPILPGGNLIKTENFREYSEDPTSIQWEIKIIICDSALSAKTSADFSVLQCWGKWRGNFYLIDQARGKWEAPELLNIAAQFWTKHNSDASPCRRFVIEEAAAGPGLMQSLRRPPISIPVHGIKPLKDKVQRVQDILTYQANGMVYLPRAGRAPWVVDFKNECAQFRADGKAKHDDMVDCFAYAIAELASKVSVFDSIMQLQQSRG